jgi:hypothetical protein
MQKGLFTFFLPLSWRTFVIVKIVADKTNINVAADTSLIELKHGF